MKTRKKTLDKKENKRISRKLRAAKEKRWHHKVPRTLKRPAGIGLFVDLTAIVLP